MDAGLTAPYVRRIPASDLANPSVDKLLVTLRRQLGAEPVARLFRTAHHRTALPGETLVRADQTGRAGILINGLLRTVVSYPGGESPTIDYMREEGFFGLASLFFPASVSVQAVKTATVIELDAATVARVAQAYPAFGWFVARQLAAEVHRTPAILEEFAFKTVRERVATHLLAICDRPTPEAELIANLTQQALAQSVGSAREVISRCLQSLKDEGVIAISPRAIHILDASGLARVATSSFS